MPAPAHRPTARTLPAAGLCALILAACAAIPDGPGAGPEALAAARGETLAREACAVCHGVGPTEASPWPSAPAFRDMRFDANAINLERRMAQLHQGRPRMPPVEMRPQDVRDVAAYVRSLKRAARP